MGGVAQHSTAMNKTAIEEIKKEMGYTESPIDKCKSCRHFQNDEPEKGTINFGECLLSPVSSIRVRYIGRCRHFSKPRNRRTKKEIEAASNSTATT